MPYITESIKSISPSSSMLEPSQSSSPVCIYTHGFLCLECSSRPSSSVTPLSLRVPTFTSSNPHCNFLFTHLSSLRAVHSWMVDALSFHLSVYALLPQDSVSHRGGNKNWEPWRPMMFLCILLRKLFIELYHICTCMYAHTNRTCISSTCFQSKHTCINKQCFTGTPETPL